MDEVEDHTKQEELEDSAKQLNELYIELAKRLTKEKVDELTEKSKQYRADLEAWQKERGMLASTLFEGSCQIDKIEQLESVINAFLLPYLVNSGHPQYTVSLERIRLDEYNYQLLLKVGDVPFGRVEAIFYSPGKFGVKIICFGGTPLFEELYRPLRELMESLADHLRQQYVTMEDWERASLAWVDRDGTIKSMSEFLNNWYQKGGSYYTQEVFKNKILHKAAENGLIEKPLAKEI
jgi:hypothetical protein